MTHPLAPRLRAPILLAPACDKAASSETGGGGGTGSTAADLAAGKLSGLYVRQQSVSMLFNGRITYSLRRDFYYFFPDGHVLFGVPASAGELKEHPTAADFAAFKDVDAEHRGTYAIASNQITFHPDKGNESTEPFSIPKPGDDSVLQIGPPNVVGSVKALPFADDQKLDGTYQYDATVGLGTESTIFNVNTLTFHPDGTITSDQLSGVDNPQATAGGTTQSKGTYHLSGYSLETTIGEKTEKSTAFRWAGDDKAASPGLLCIAGRVYNRQESKP
jgi:hypothetical protein